MNVDILGGKSFSYLKVLLKPDERIIAESGAMASMDYGIDLKTGFRGSFFSALLRFFFGKESLFINEYFNDEKVDKEIYITKDYPGEIVEQVVKPGESHYIQKGAFIASDDGVHFGLSWAGFFSWMAGEGLIRLKVHGEGRFWYGAYGSVVEKEVTGEYIVDTGHLLSYPPEITIKIQLSGGLFSSFFSGEGFVARLEGNGKVKLQTRSLQGTAGWLNPQFYS